MIALIASALASAPPLPACSASTDAKQVAASERLQVLYVQASAEGGSVESRVKEVLKLKKRVCTAQDHAHAGWILLQSRDPKVLEKAYTYGQVAAYHHAPKAQQLVTRAYDAWRISLGERQRYGTQVAPDGSCLYAFEDGFTDDQRAAWGAPPKDATIAAFLKSKGLENEPANETTMLRRQLFCPH